MRHFIFGIFILCIGCCLSSCLLLQPGAEKLTKRALKAHSQYDAIVVPGVPFNAPQWDMTMQMRVLWAVHLYQRGFTKNIIMSGGAVYSPYVEGQMMKLYAIKLGVPAENILVDDKAQHSTENLWYSHILAQKNGLTHIALATDPFQTRMLYRFGRRRLKSVKYLPVIFDTLRTLDHSTPTIDYLPHKKDSFTSIIETQSKWYRLKGTMGKNINFKQK